MRFGSNTLSLASKTVLGSLAILWAAHAAIARPPAEAPKDAPKDAAKDSPTPNAEMKAVLDKLATLGGKPIETLSAEDAREQPTPTDAVIALMKDRGLPTAPPPGLETDDREILDVPVRVYTPQREGDADDEVLPVIVYIHGGGFVIATIDTYDASARALASNVGAVVVSVEYAKAPEKPFPASHEDVYKVTQWVMNHAGEIKGDPNRVAIAGESAGGNMATAVCLMAKDRGGKMPVHQLLVYPVVDNDMNTESYRQNADAKPLNKAMMAWFFDKASKNPADTQSPYLMPLKNADVSGLPPATIVLAEIDPLRSEGEAYAQKLKKAGVDTELKLYEGVTHEFFGMNAVLDDAQAAQTFASARLKESLKK
jgi:acetyl esterase